MLASRVFSRASMSFYVHCSGSFLLSPSQNQQFQILSKHFHYLCESPSKLAICKAFPLHHAALSSFAFRPTNEDVIEILEVELQKLVEKDIEYDEKLRKLVRDSNSSALANPEQKSISSSAYELTKDEAIVLELEEEMQKHLKHIEYEEKLWKLIPVNVLGHDEDMNKVSQHTEESCFNSKSQPTKSQSIIKTRTSTNIKPAKKSSCDSKSQATKSCSNSNSKGKSEVSMDDLLERVIKMDSILEWKRKKIMKTEANICQSHAKLGEDMGKLKKRVKMAKIVAIFAIVVGAYIGYDLDVVKVFS